MGDQSSWYNQEEPSDLQMLVFQAENLTCKTSLPGIENMGWFLDSIRSPDPQVPVRDQQPGGHRGGDLRVPEVHLLYPGQLPVPPCDQLSAVPV